MRHPSRRRARHSLPKMVRLRWASPDAGSLAQRRVSDSALASSRYAAMAIILAFPNAGLSSAPGLSDANPENAVCHFFPNARYAVIRSEPDSPAPSRLRAVTLSRKASSLYRDFGNIPAPFRPAGLPISCAERPREAIEAPRSKYLRERTSARTAFSHYSH